MTSWLWPDHVISKRESRQLREEHNTLANSQADLLEALRNLTDHCVVMELCGEHCDYVKAARTAIASAPE